jgi:hypothetical protein
MIGHIDNSLTWLTDVIDIDEYLEGVEVILSLTFQDIMSSQKGVDLLFTLGVYL